MNWEPIASIAITVLLCTGVALRRRVRWHVPLMWTVIVSDVALLLWVELSRQAIDTALSLQMPGFLFVHIALAIIVIAGYLFAAGAGIALVRNRQSPVRRWHRLNGGVVVAARIGMLVTTPGLFFPALGT